MLKLILKASLIIATPIEMLLKKKTLRAQERKAKCYKF